MSSVLGVTRRMIPDDEILQRLLFPLINEGFKILEEGYADKPSDIDVCYVHGYAFPRYKGGPMFYADQIGLSLVKKTLGEMGIQPAQLLCECVEANMSLAKFWKSPKRPKKCQNHSRL